MSASARQRGLAAARGQRTPPADPGNWGTDLQGGAQFKYGLLWVVAMASLMAIFLQVLSARLGVVTGKDLAQACRDWYPKWTRWPNWLFCELAIVVHPPKCSVLRDQPLPSHSSGRCSSPPATCSSSSPSSGSACGP